VALYEGEDFWSSNFRTNGVYSVRSTYEVLSGSVQMSGGVSEETIRALILV